MLTNIGIIGFVLAILIELLALYVCNKERVYYKKQFENLSEINTDLHEKIEQLTKEILFTKGAN